MDNKVFDLLANVRKKANGSFVYSLQLNEDKNTKAAPPNIPSNNTQVSNRAQTASVNNISQPDTSVNSQQSTDGGS